MSLRTLFGWQGLASAGLAAVLAAAHWLSLGPALDDEAEKARFLKGEIAKLDREIAEVRQLNEAVQMLLARKQIVETLHAERYAVQLFEELARTRPDGVYFASLRDEGRLFFVTAFASSERQANSFLANLKASAFFDDAQLRELRAESAPKLAAYPVRLTVSMVQKGGRRPPASGARPALPADVHPGDPK